MGKRMFASNFFQCDICFMLAPTCGAFLVDKLDDRIIQGLFQAYQRPAIACFLLQSVFHPGHVHFTHQPTWVTGIVHRSNNVPRNQVHLIQFGILHSLEEAMQVHFTFNEGQGVEHDGIHHFKDLGAAKADAIQYLAEVLKEEAREAGEIAAAVAALDADGNPFFSMSMHVTIDVSHR